MAALPPVSRPHRPSHHAVHRRHRRIPPQLSRRHLRRLPYRRFRRRHMDKRYVRIQPYLAVCPCRVTLHQPSSRLAMVQQPACQRIQPISVWLLHRPVQLYAHVPRHPRPTQRLIFRLPPLHRQPEKQFSPTPCQSIHILRIIKKEHSGCPSLSGSLKMQNPFSGCLSIYKICPSKQPEIPLIHFTSKTTSWQKISLS